MIKFKLWWYFNITYYLFRNKKTDSIYIYTPEKRLEDYKSALEFMTSLSKRSNIWFCIYFTRIHCYPEIYRHKPMFMYTGFWFPKSEFGNQVRLEILKRAIKKLENAENYPITEWLRWYDNDKGPKI